MPAKLPIGASFTIQSAKVKWVTGFGVLRPERMPHVVVLRAIAADGSEIDLAMDISEAPAALRGLAMEIEAMALDAAVPAKGKAN